MCVCVCVCVLRSNEALLSAGVELFPTNYLHHYNLGVELESQAGSLKQNSKEQREKYEEAEGLLRTAIRLRPDSPRAYSNLATLLNKVE